MMMNFDEGGKRAIADLSISDCRFQIEDQTKVVSQPIRQSEI